VAGLALTTHNAFWFQGFPFEGTDPGGPAEPVFAALAAEYRRLAPDCLCLQEVQSEAAARRLAAELGMSAAWCPGGELPQYGLAVLARLPVEARDWRSTGFTPERGWLLARAGRLLVANVHLPSGRQSGSARARAQRIEELREVLRQDPDVLVGDLNERPGGEVWRFLAGRGYADAAEATGAGHLATGRSRQPPKRTDYAWVRSGLAAGLEYAVVAEEDFGAPAGAAGLSLLSDHFPVTVGLRLGRG